VEALLHLGREGGPQLVGVADRPVAVLVGDLIGAEVLGEDVVGADGLDERPRSGDVGVVQGRRDEEDADAGEVFEVLLEQHGVAGLEEAVAADGDDVAAIVEVGAPVDGEVGVPVQGPLWGDGNDADLEGVPGRATTRRAGGMPTCAARSTQLAGTTNVQPERSAMMRAVASPKWSPCSWVMKTTSRTAARSAVGTGDGLKRLARSRSRSKATSLPSARISQPRLPSQHRPTSPSMASRSCRIWFIVPTGKTTQPSSR
jgi:hypothetical protein